MPRAKEDNTTIDKQKVKSVYKNIVMFSNGIASKKLKDFFKDDKMWKKMICKL